ncbi:peptide-methionine (R)-S-oxide reductase MsrB [Methylobacterium nigriterrae]|uniref:peptide-methionine (R)-S-oxide reductase MsrB n=1 Tax=Methylobacterium nigriterrae TaxID=3127512 RepID=UPI0030141C9E
MNRRWTLFAGASLLGMLAGWRALGRTETEIEHFEVQKSDADWRRQLSAAEYAILRGHGTERAGSSPLNHEKRPGRFACAGCDLPLFSSDTKFESGTGWPSFWAPLPDAVSPTSDTMFGMSRTEVHCRRCGGHLGHVFNDGPPPTGQRYCMNGAALRFLPI